MSDPISTLNQSSPSNACIVDDGEASAASAPAPATLPPPPPSAVPGLVARFSSATAPPSKPAVSAPPAIALSITTLHTSAGAAAGGGSYRVAASALEQDMTIGPATSHLDLGSVSVQYGKDNDVQVVLARRSMALSHGGYGVSVIADAGTARANLGEHNDDGSIGGNIGAGVEALGAEATVDTPYGSLTGGVSVSASLSGSIGVRDADHDGKPEFCAKFSIPAFTLGACVEQFW